MYPVSKEDWNKATEYSQEVDNLTKNYGVIPTLERIQEIPNLKGITHQRTENDGTPKSNQYRILMALIQYLERELELSSLHLEDMFLTFPLG